MYEQYLALNNLQGFIFHETLPANQYIYIYIYIFLFLFGLMIGLIFTPHHNHVFMCLIC